MNLLAMAIHNRGQVNSNYKTSIGGRQYFVKAKQKATYPYVVFFKVGDKNDDFLGVESIPSNSLQDIAIQFNIYSQNSVDDPSEAGMILQYLTTHYDYCNLSVTGYRNLKMKRMNTYGPFWIESDQAWVYSVEYQIQLQKN